MKNVLIIGSLPADEKRRKLYESIKACLETKANIIRTPLDTALFKGSDSERFELAQACVENADCIVAELSESSTGCGIEIGMVYLLGKNIIVLAEQGSKFSMASSLVKGMPNVQKIIIYRTIAELKDMLVGIEI